MKRINWSTEKSQLLRESRGVSFEDLIFHIEQGEVMDDYLHPNQEKYAGQRIMVICFENYAYPVPYVEDEEELFLKTIIPSRKATEKYLGEDHGSENLNRGKRNPEQF